MSTIVLPSKSDDCGEAGLFGRFTFRDQSVLTAFSSASSSGVRNQTSPAEVTSQSVSTL